jgi:hypothetical protein
MAFRHIFLTRSTKNCTAWASRSANVALLITLFVCAARPSAGELPEGLSRFNPAGLALNWHYEGTAFQVFSSPVSNVSTIPILRLHHATRGYLLTGSESEAASAENMGFVREGIAFHAVSRSSFPVFRFQNAINGSFFYTIARHDRAAERLSYDGIAFYAYDQGPSRRRYDNLARSAPITVLVARYRDDVSGLYLFTAARESPYVVGAFYFGSFSPSAKTIIAATERFYGRKDDWWGGVKDFYGEEPGIPANRRGWTGDWRNLKPAIGYYNQQSTTTLEQHIRQASDAGLAFFSFYWYWSKSKQGEILPEALNSYLHATNVNALRFNLSLYAHPWDDDLAIDATNSQDIAKRLVTYFGHPQYLRLPDGRPVFAIGDDRNIRTVSGDKCGDAQCVASALDTFLSLLRRLSLEALGVTPFVQIQAEAPGWNLSKEIDGVSCLAPSFKIESHTPYPEFGPSIFESMTHTGKPVSPCMLENFDERPRQDILIPDRAAIHYLIGKTPTLFRRNLLAAKSFSDSAYLDGKHPATRIIYLYAWNEWHEGGILEPNINSNALDLNVVTDVFQLPRSPSACLDHGQCKLRP